MPETQNQPARRRIAEYMRQIDPVGQAADFAMTQTIPDKLYRVSEIAQHLGLTRQTVHNYTTIGLITEKTQTPGGQRLFDESVFGRLIIIQQLKRSHRLHDIRRMLDADEFNPEEVPDREDPDA
jgi:hypothetical protein